MKITQRTGQSFTRAYAFRERQRRRIVAAERIQSRSARGGSVPVYRSGNGTKCGSIFGQDQRTLFNGRPGRMLQVTRLESLLGHVRPRRIFLERLRPRQTNARSSGNGSKRPAVRIFQRTQVRHRSLRTRDVCDCASHLYYRIFILYPAVITERKGNDSWKVAFLKLNFRHRRKKKKEKNIFAIDENSV